MAIPMAKISAKLSIIPAPAADRNGIPSKSSCPNRNNNAAAGSVAIGNINDLPIFCRKPNIFIPPLCVFLLLTIKRICIVVYTNLKINQKNVFAFTKLCGAQGRKPLSHPRKPSAAAISENSSPAELCRAQGQSLSSQVHFLYNLNYEYHRNDD